MTMTEADIRSYITGVIPFLEEAWKACFQGQEQRMLSAEERGMGTLLQQFRTIAAGTRVIPLDCILAKDADRNMQVAIDWAHRTLGSPNELKPELREWVRLGETCADGLERANAEVIQLRAALDGILAHNWCHESDAALAAVRAARSVHPPTGGRREGRFLFIPRDEAQEKVDELMAELGRSMQKRRDESKID